MCYRSMAVPNEKSSLLPPPSSNVRNIPLPVPLSSAPLASSGPESRILNPSLEKGSGVASTALPTWWADQSYLPTRPLSLQSV